MSPQAGSSGPISRSSRDETTIRDIRRKWTGCRPIALIDSLFAELEVLNLAGCPRVPGSFQPSLQWLLDNCSVECSQPGVGVSPVQLMDALFDLQESLLAIKGGSLRHRLDLEDERRGWCEAGD